MKQGFTLIELLVVVLIIGILAAVAMPQYQKAVEKSKSTQAITLLKSVAQAEEAYFMSNNHYANNFSDLDIQIPWKGNTPFATSWISTASNDEWSLQANLSGEGQYVSADIIGVLRLKGRYRGAGFAYLMDNDFTSSSKGLYCAERTANGIIFEGTAGDYCSKIFKGKYEKTLVSLRLYRMP